jgi:hypothetical protein
MPANLLRVPAPASHYLRELRYIAGIAFVLCLALPAPASTILWDYGPLTGTFAGQYLNLTGTMMFADRIVFTAPVVIEGYIHFTPANVAGRGFEFRILADDGGKPGGAIATFHQTFSGTAPLVGDFGPYSIFRVEFRWAQPVRLSAGVYWFGMSGDGFNAYQFTVNKPGDGQTAQFYSSGYAGMVPGDQLFQLTGYADTSATETGTGMLALAGALFAAARYLWKRRRGPSKTRPAPARQII